MKTNNEVSEPTPKQKKNSAKQEGERCAQWCSVELATSVCLLLGMAVPDDTLRLVVAIGFKANPLLLV